ncbi:MAG TPA: hypothetical protein PLK32_08210 [Defluviitoga tunisiensis]|nr:hypothetical protein [Defluviitoga tunisiensis]
MEKIPEQLIYDEYPERKNWGCFLLLLLLIFIFTATLYGFWKLFSWLVWLEEKGVI